MPSLTQDASVLEASLAICKRDAREAELSYAVKLTAKNALHDERTIALNRLVSELLDSIHSIPVFEKFTPDRFFANSIQKPGELPPVSLDSLDQFLKS